jgi:hypothetical protein
MSKFISQAEYARQKDVSRQYINKLVQAGRIPTDEKKRIDPDIADAVLVQDADPARRLNDPEYESESIIEQDSDVGSSVSATGHTPFAKFRSAREAYQAKLAQLDYEERAGQLLKKAEVERETFDVARQLRDRFLSLPQELSGTLVSLTDEKEIKKYLRAKIRDTLMEVADDVSLGA